MSIPISEDVASIRAFGQSAGASGRLVGLVPTMGALHDGHLKLVEMAALECDDVIISIYVNPTQFGQNEDLSTYPVDFDKDYQALLEINAKLEKELRYKGRVSMIFRPNTEMMYPFTAKSESKLLLDPSLTQILEGASRPHFFGGVATVVSKLFNIVQADRAYFGQKDIQQIIVVQRMIKEFHFPTTLRCVRTVREKDGLAMSSRNLYLGNRRRAAAIALCKALQKGYAQFEAADNLPREKVLTAALNEFERLQAEQRVLPPHERVQLQLDYMSLADPISLKELDVVNRASGAILTGAMLVLPLEEPQPEEVLGIGDDARTVRLIDNLLLGDASSHLGLIQDVEEGGLIESEILS